MLLVLYNLNLEGLIQVFFKYILKETPTLKIIWHNYSFNFLTFCHILLIVHYYYLRLNHLFFINFHLIL